MGRASFTHRIFIDFSGDDGDPRTPGSSRYICIAWVLSKEEDIYYNQGIALAIKKIIGTRKDAELKYTSLKRHRHKSAALNILAQAKIQVLLAPILKERLTDEELKNPRTKRLINLIHDFPLSRFLDEFDKDTSDVYFQLVFDEVGWAGCQEEIARLFRQKPRLDLINARTDWLRFAKSGGNLMLQIADLIAGLGYEYMSGLQETRLPPCQVCWLKGRSRCRSLPNNNKNLLNVVYPWLLKNNNGIAWEYGFVVRPPGTCRDYMFVDCLFSTQIKQQRSTGRK